MAKGFDTKEKAKIRKSLLEEGREAFVQNGLRKTNVASLTSAVGIAQGSFYLFFPSKEGLYFEVIEEEEAKIKKTLQDEFLDQPLTREVFKTFLIRGLTLISDNSIIQQLLQGDDFLRLTKKLSSEKLQQHAENDVFALTPFLEKWGKQGNLNEVRPEILTAILRSFFLMTLHRKEIGTDVFDVTIERLAELYADGLVKEETND
ncbi:TetR/AcrR family transcriptional regulator [Alkalihalobacillus sp. TS-13]|uniref:TetR/AcrR family transcriptional regulator n=1 Tax=Alkalihalobacillus sp. TS-13 TaxID=2842455 RepID=UPI001C8838EC|nr:TetR/AcrR family transcriptional regulator [Alkalihalobacillus sp. TS-13]